MSTGLEESHTSLMSTAVGDRVLSRRGSLPVLMATRSDGQVRRRRTEVLEGDPEECTW